MKTLSIAHLVKKCPTCAKPTFTNRTWSTQPLKEGKRSDMTLGRDCPYLRQLWLPSFSHRLFLLLACYCYHINRGRAVCNSRVASISPCSITSSFFFLPTTTVHYLHCLRTNTNLYPSWKIKEYDNPRSGDRVWTNSPRFDMSMLALGPFHVFVLYLISHLPLSFW